MTRVASLALAVTVAGCTTRLDLGHDLGTRDAGAGTSGSSGSAGSGGTAGSGEGGGGTGESVDLALGAATAVAFRGEAVVFWGLDDRGQIGVDPADAHDDCNGLPCSVAPIHGMLPGLVALELGGRHGCAILGTELQCWGDDHFGQLGREIATPDPHPLRVRVEVTSPSAVALGRFHTCVLADGAVSCFGLGEHGELGVDPAGLGRCSVPADLSALLPGEPADVACSATPAVVPGTTGARALVAGAFGTCALFAAEPPLCWGRNATGELGVASGSAEVVASPTPFAVGSAVAIALGEHHGCALLPGKTVRCFGSGARGEVGAGSLPAEDCDGAPCYLTPVPASDLSGVAAIAAGRHHSCALLEAGEVRCWGADPSGQLGNSSAAIDTCASTDGDVPCATTPEAVYGITEAARLRAGDDFSCVVETDGDISCWGDNSLAQMAAYNREPATFPTAIYNLFPE